MGKSKKNGHGFSAAKPTPNTKQTPHTSPFIHTEKEQKALALINQGLLQEAEVIYSDLVNAGSSNHIVHGNLGVLLKLKGNLKSAIASFTNALKLNPNYPNAHNNLGVVLQEQGELTAAITSYSDAIKLKPNYSDAHFNLGNALWEQGKLDHALESTLKSLELKPDSPNALMNLGGIYQQLNKLDQALASTLQSLELKPDNPDALINLGSIYKDLEKIEDAKTAVYQALKRTTEDSPTLTLIFEFYDSTNNQDLLEEAIIYFKGTLPIKSIRIIMYEARALFRRRYYEESWEKLPTLETASKELKDWFSISKYHTFRAQIAEKNSHYEEAYFSFEASQKHPLYKSINHKKEYSRIQEYITLSKNMAKDGARQHHDNQMRDGSNPVFLIGFPRSGTTLLDTVLRSHPNIEVLEEKDPLTITENLGISNLQVQISNFNSLNEDDLNKMRKAYLARLRFHSEGVDKLIIDKLPLHTIAIPLINLLFPNAKVIFALRHPCDSILSCFQQTFKPNTAMANFTNLERSVDFYDEVMNSWTNYNANLNVDYTMSKYEDLLDNFDESILKILNHLNLTWDDRVRDYRNTAMNRRLINTPSSSQVVQPLYRSSMGRWKNYQKYFVKHMEKLNPWINYFSYNI